MNIFPLNIYPRHLSFLLTFYHIPFLFVCHLEKVMRVVCVRHTPSFNTQLDLACWY